MKVHSKNARHRDAVLEVAGTGQPFTRVGLAEVTGLSNATISALVADLLIEGTLLELDERIPAQGKSGGRPAAALSLNPGLGTLIGMHLGHASVRILITSLDGTVRAEHTHDIDVDHRPADTLEYVASAALELVADNNIAYRKLRGVGVGVSAPVVLHSQLLGAPMLSDWSGVDIAARLHRRMGLTAHVRNDANLGALAEWRLGAGSGTHNMIYVMLSEGVGAGMILQGQLYEGAGGAAGELGHVTVVPAGQICRCGSRGCLETIVGQHALASTLAYSRGPGSCLGDLIQLAQQRDPGAERLINDAGRAVGTALASACTMLNPELIVIGGTLAQTGTPLLDGVRDSLNRYMSSVSDRAPSVVAGALGSRAEALGAIIVARQAALQG